MGTSRLFLVFTVLKRILYSVGLVLITATLVLAGLAAMSYLDKQRWKHQVNEAVRQGQLEIYRVSTDWNVEKEYRLDVTIWMKNNSTRDLAGTWVFRLSLDHTRLAERFLKQFVKEHSSNHLLQQIETGRPRDTATPKAKAIEAFIVRGNRVLPKLSHESVLLESEGPKAFEILFRSLLSLKAGEIGKIEHQIEVPPEEIGYVAEISLDHVEPH
jgi:hypothetical protein